MPFQNGCVISSWPVKQSTTALVGGWIWMHARSVPRISVGSFQLRSSPPLGRSYPRVEHTLNRVTLSVCRREKAFFIQRGKGGVVEGTLKSTRLSALLRPCPIQDLFLHLVRLLHGTWQSWQKPVGRVHTIAITIKSSWAVSLCERGSPVKLCSKGCRGDTEFWCEVQEVSFKYTVCSMKVLRLKICMALIPLKRPFRRNSAVDIIGCEQKTLLSMTAK